MTRTSIGFPGSLRRPATISSAVTSANGRCQTSVKRYFVWNAASKPRVLIGISNSPTDGVPPTPSQAGWLDRGNDRRRGFDALTGPAALQVHEQRVAPRRHVERDVERDPRFLVQHRLDPVLLALRQRDPVRPGRQVGRGRRIAVPMEGVQMEASRQLVDVDVHPLEATDEQVELVGLVGVVLEEVAADRDVRNRLEELVLRLEDAVRLERAGEALLRTPRRTRHARRARPRHAPRPPPRSTPRSR